jgi:hypothetical protein
MKDYSGNSSKVNTNSIASKEVNVSDGNRQSEINLEISFSDVDKK